MSVAAGAISEDAARPRKHAREDVATVRVGPEREAPLGRQARRELVVEDRVVPGHEPGEERAEDPEGEHERADEHRGRAEHEAKSLRARGACLAEWGRRRSWEVDLGHSAAPPSRIRGFSAA